MRSKAGSFALSRAARHAGCEPAGARKRRSGLSMIELLLALTVLALGLIGMLTMQTLALQGSRYGKETSEAAHVADDQMEWLLRQPWAAIPVSAWSAPRVVLGPALGAVNESPQSYTVIWRVQAGPDPSLRSLDVQVTWVMPEAPAGTPPRIYAFSSVRHNDP